MIILYILPSYSASAVIWESCQPAAIVIGGSGAKVVASYEFFIAAAMSPPPRQFPRAHAFATVAGLISAKRLPPHCDKMDERFSDLRRSIYARQILARYATRTI